MAAKNPSTSSASGKEGGPKRTVGWASGRGPKGTIRDPEDFPALVPPAGSSTNLTAYTLIERFFEGPIMYWVPALMKNSNNYKVKLKFHLFWFIKYALFKLLIDSFQQKLLKLNGSKDSNGRVVYTKPGNLDIINNAILNVFSSIINLAGRPVLVRAVRTARTEWKKHELGRGKAAELIIVVVDFAVHGDSLGVPGGVNDGGQDGQFLLIVDDVAGHKLIERFFGGSGDPDVTNIDHVSDDNLTDSDPVNEGEEEARRPGLSASSQRPLVPGISRRRGQTAEYS